MAKLPLDDVCQELLKDDYVSSPVIFDANCYICNDPEFAQMGLPLCYACRFCGGHVAADDVMCDVCGRIQSGENNG